MPVLPPGGIAIVTGLHRSSAGIGDWAASVHAGEKVADGAQDSSADAHLLIHGARSIKGLLGLIGSHCVISLISFDRISDPWGDCYEVRYRSCIGVNWMRQYRWCS